MPLLGDPLRRDRRGRGPRPVRGAPRQPRRARAGLGPRGRRPAARERSRTRSATPCWCGRPTSSAAAGCSSRASPLSSCVDGPALIDRFLEGAIELDVDVLCDGETGWVASVLEHVERAGVHSGDSACVVPGAVGHARASRARSATLVGDARARRSAPGGCSTSSSRCTTASCTCSRRTRAPRAQSPSSSKATGHPARRPRLPAAARRVARRARPAGARRARIVPGRRRRSSPPSASPAPPTGASRCARPAR